MNNSAKIVFLLLWALLACSEQTSSDDVPGQASLSPEGKKANREKAATYDLLSVKVGTERNQVNVSEHHLHGRFFLNRAEFYVVENPELYVSNAEVKELTLYFIDGKLCKKKYKLAVDISSELMRTYGSFKFVPGNLRTRDLAKSEEIVLKTTDGNVLNEGLERFEMKWDDGDILIRYHMDKDSLDLDIFLEEELSAYKYLLLAAGRSSDLI